MTHKSLILYSMLFSTGAIWAQQTYHSAQYLTIDQREATPLFFQTSTSLADCSIPSESIIWGMDVAWNSADNVTRGTNYIGKEVLKVGRVSFQPSDLVDASGRLSTAQQQTLQSRLDNIAISGVKDIVLNCDHEVLCNKDNFPNCDQNYANYNGKPYEWYRVIKASVQYCTSRGFNVVAISPFNEPDYTGWKEGSKADFKAICKYISEDSDLACIRISAGNTLNCDQAYAWYNYMKPYVTEGNTHQLAGSFDNYAAFWQTVRNDGNHATADELHNTMEAFVGAHYGMQTGIWWGFEGAARGEYCQSSYYGKEIGYAENRDAWSAATVYKRPDGRIDAFLGASERQATNSAYEFVNTDRPAYYDGQGPTHHFYMHVPGGTGYSKDQPNAERLIRVLYGEDVPCEAITQGEYVIMSAAKTTVLGPSGGTLSGGTPITLGSYTLTKTNEYQKWIVTPIDERHGSDFSYYSLNLKNTMLMMNLNNWSTEPGGTVIAYAGGLGSNEQWQLDYAGDNLWYIRSRHSGLYLEASSSSVSQRAFTGAKEQKWRFMPAGCRRELTAPKAPTGLQAEARSASIALSWAANTESDLADYEVLRAPQGTQDWDVIGRMVPGTEFIDNMLTPGKAYSYKVKAIDQSRNRSEASASIDATTAQGKALIAHYSFDENLDDATPNLLQPQLAGKANYSSTLGLKEGSHALRLSNTAGNYLMLPNTVAALQEMTLATWVHNLSYTKSWTRIFDFGNGLDQYMFLTPYNGSEMRFVMKNKGDEQILSATRLASGMHHIAVTIGNDAVKLYVDGTEVASSSNFTIKPSDIRGVRNYLGRSQFPADPLFDGYLDDFRIYNYALTATDVNTLYNGGEVSALPYIETNQEGPQRRYDLNGRQVPYGTKGLLLMDGKKIYKK